MSAKYPYLKVIFGYAILGGYVGGLLFFAWLGIAGVIVELSNMQFRKAVFSLLLTPIFSIILGFMGILFGTIPATICGILVAIFHVKRTAIGYFQAACFGLIAYYLSSYAYHFLRETKYIGLSGGIENLILCISSSLIVLRLVAPKPCRQPENKFSLLTETRK